jgi:hypothetical protein
VRDRQTQTTVRASVTADGTETGFELGSLNASPSADGQVVAFESEGRWSLRTMVSRVDVFVHERAALADLGGRVGLPTWQ